MRPVFQKEVMGLINRVEGLLQDFVVHVRVAVYGMPARPPRPLGGVTAGVPYVIDGEGRGDT